jgi:uncharacterized membrane protein
MTDNAANKMLQTCTALYAVFAASMLMQLTPYTMIPGSVALLFAVVMAYITYGKAGDSFYASHCRWLVRTFWIGGVVYMPILTVLASITVMAVVDLSEVESAVKAAALEQHPGGESDQSIVVNTVLQSVMDKSGGTIMLIAALFTLPVFGWWLWRCWQGYSLLKQGKPVTDVMRWV